jgi:hypothetical protein
LLVHGVEDDRPLASRKQSQMCVGVCRILNSIGHETRHTPLVLNLLPEIDC